MPQTQEANRPQLWYVWLYEEVSRFLWPKPEQYDDGTLVQSERAICAVRGFSILGLLPVALYGAIAGYCAAGHCAGEHASGISILRGASIALLGAIAAFSVGGLLGFLFGVPRWSESTVVVEAGKRKTDTPPAGKAPVGEAGKQGSPAGAEGKGAPSLTAAAAGSPPAADAVGTPANPQDEPGPAGRANRVRPNTGLEKVMDWLTTLIVGLGLVHLGTAAEYGREVSGWLTAAIANESGYDAKANFTGGATILIAYAISGFMLVYLWAQRNWGKEMALADLESNTIQSLKRVAQQAEAKAEQAQAQVREVKKSAAKKLTGVTAAVEAFAEKAAGGSDTLTAVAGREDLSQRVMLKEGPLSGLDDATVDDIMDRYQRDSDWFYEPMAGLGPQEVAGRRLDASVRTFGAIYEITLSVRAIAPAPPIAGDVIFFLHHTLPNPVRRVRAVNGAATVTVVSAGSFVAAAILAAEPAIKLSLDLAKLPDVPQEFRDT